MLADNKQPAEEFQEFYQFQTTVQGLKLCLLALGESLGVLAGGEASNISHSRLGSHRHRGNDRSTREGSRIVLQGAGGQRARGLNT